MTTRPSARRIVVTGADGQVGWELLRTLAPLGRVVPLRRSDVELTDLPRLRAVIREIEPAAIVNAAAYTAVDRAESEPELALAINGRAPGVLSEEAARLGVPIVHYSTDYVFDGSKGSPYLEDDETGPLGVYGETKLAGERAVAASGATHIVFRTSWVYGVRGHNFLRTMVRLAREREELRVVADQRGTPTPARLVAQVTAAVLARCSCGDGFDVPDNLPGLYHLTARGETSWHGFAEAILAACVPPASNRVRSVTPIGSHDYRTAARRPSCSVLDVSRLEKAFGLIMPEWRAQLDLVAEELRAGVPG